MNGWIGMGGTLLELNLADVILAECRGAMMLMLFVMLMLIVIVMVMLMLFWSSIEER